jgi:hypothetical protein
MGDIVFIVVTLVFFAFCWMYVRGCERIIEGSSEEEPERLETTR